MTRVTVGITGVHAGCQRSPGLAVARALHGTANYDVIAIDYDNLATGLYLPYFKAVEVLPWTTDLAEFLGHIRTVHQKHSLNVLIPCLNEDIGPTSELERQLQLLGIATLLPPKSSVEARGKAVLPRLAEELGLRHPETVVCKTDTDLEAAIHQIGCPCVVKGPECGVFPVRSKELFDYYATYCATSFEFPVLVQEWMEGEEFSVFCLCDNCSNLWISVTVKKLGIADDGESWMSMVVDGAEFEPYMRRLVSLLDWVGPVECDLLKGDDGIYLLDVNPRFPAWIDGLASVGCNVPSLATQLAQKLKPFKPEVAPVVGAVFFKDFEDTCFSIDSMISE